MKKEIKKDKDGNPIFIDEMVRHCKVCRTEFRQPIGVTSKCPHCDIVEMGIKAGAD